MQDGTQGRGCCKVWDTMGHKTRNGTPGDVDEGWDIMRYMGVMGQDTNARLYVVWHGMGHGTWHGMGHGRGRTMRHDVGHGIGQERGQGKGTYGAGMQHGTWERTREADLREDRGVLRPHVPTLTYPPLLQAVPQTPAASQPASSSPACRDVCGAWCWHPQGPPGTPLTCGTARWGALPSPPAPPSLPLTPTQPGGRVLSGLLLFFQKATRKRCFAALGWLRGHRDPTGMFTAPLPTPDPSHAGAAGSLGCLLGWHLSGGHKGQSWVLAGTAGPPSPPVLGHPLKERERVWGPCVGLRLGLSSEIQEERGHRAPGGTGGSVGEERGKPVLWVGHGGVGLEREHGGVRAWG